MIMGRDSDKVTERVSFEVTGELAEWMAEMKRRGYFAQNPEIVRLALTVLQHHYNRRLGVIVERETNESVGG